MVERGGVVEIDVESATIVARHELPGARFPNDIAVAAESAIFSFSEVKIGLVPACISPFVLKRVGERYGREYFITCKRLSAKEAEACGLVNRAVPDDQLDAVVGKPVGRHHAGAAAVGYHHETLGNAAIVGRGQRLRGRK